jgi:hypothetical protein
VKEREKPLLLLLLLLLLLVVVVEHFHFCRLDFLRKPALLAYSWTGKCQSDSAYPLRDRRIYLIELKCSRCVRLRS